MNTPKSNAQVDELLRKGIQAAQAKDKTAARTLLEQVVELDQHNEKAWFWLAAVTDRLEEKRVCLTNVLVINPQNTRAQRLLDQLEDQPVAGKPVSSPAKSEATGLKAVYLAIGLGTAAVIGLLVVLILVLSQGDEGGTSTDDSDGDAVGVSASDGQLSGNGDKSPTAVGGSADTPGQGGTATQPGDGGPATDEVAFQPAATRTTVPTWTPLPTPLPPTATATREPLPPGIRGRIIMQSGEIISYENNLPIVTINPDGSNRTVISPSSEYGHAPVLSPGGSYYAYITVSGGQDVILQTNNMEGTDRKGANKYWGGAPIINDQDTPAWSFDGDRIAFVGTDLTTNLPDLYVVHVTGEEENSEALRRLTEDEAIERWPAFSADGQFIVYASQFALPEGDIITELRIYNLNTDNEPSANLTNNGNDLIEAAPDWPPAEGPYQNIVLQGLEAGAGDTDIYWIPIDGPPQPVKIIDSDANDIQPRFSPDGRYIVFSSERNGNWDVFIFDIATETTYRVTSDSWTDIANDWGE